jgi:hypothetical protein
MVRRWRLIGYFPILYNPSSDISTTLMSQPQLHRTVSDNITVREL